MIILGSLVMLVTLLSGTEMPFLEEYFHPCSIIAAFTQEAIGNRFGELAFTKEDGIVKTGIESFNQLAAELRIVDLEQMHDFVTNLDWSENGVYIQNIYRIVLESNDNIEKALSAIARDKNILFAEYESKVFSLYIPNDPHFGMQWHHPVIQTPEAWDYVQGSSEIIVAITDSGTKWNHEDLADNIWINEAELPGITIDWVNGLIIGGDGIDNDGNGKVDDVIGWDFVDNNNNPMQIFPGNTHGTHVAGCAGAVGDNNIGITGSAMNVSLMICKGAPSNAPSSGIQFAYDQVLYAGQSGAHIINCSWISLGNGVYPNYVVNYVTNLGSLVIAGAGNNNVQHTPGYAWFPSDADNSLSVAATNQSDIKATFSDYGNPIDLAAPGVAIRSTYYSGGQDDYTASQGTSMASPIVAGVAALVKTLHPNMPPLELKDRLMDTTDYIDDLNPNFAGLLGTGRINAFKATMSDKIPNISVYSLTTHEHSGDGDNIPNPGEEINLILSLYNEIFWLLATDVTATITTDHPGVEILIGTVPFPNIDGGSIVFNSNNPLRFTTTETLNDLTIPFNLNISANPDSEFPYERNQEILITLSLQRSGWPLDLNAASTSSAAIWDLNGNGTREVIFGDSQGNLQVRRINGSSLAGFPVNLGSNISSAVAVADLNNNNNAEIVATTQNGMIYCLDTSGNIIFQYDAQGQIRSNPMLIDVNNNGNLEIVALTFTNPKLIILNHDGSELSGFPVNISGAVLSSPASADLNGDGNKEIIFSTNTGSLHAVSIVNGQDITGWPQSVGATSWNGPIVADLSSNNQPCVIIATLPGFVYAFDRHGNDVFTRNVGNQIRAGVVAEDLNNNGQLEIIVADMAGNLFVLDNSSNNWGSFPVNTGYAIESTPILADMNIDGNQDIIFGDNEGLLHSMNISGNQTPNFPLQLHGGAITASPAIMSIDGSSRPDILVPSGNKYNCIDYKRAIGSVSWGFYKGNIRRSGNSFDMLSYEEIPEDIALVTELRGNYPNPFNPDTTIRFSLANDSNVRLVIYNIRGQQVKDLVNEKMEKGLHNIMWDGTDDRGRNVGSGVYFYRLDSEEYRATRKMMMIK